jgi:hypothetical protein
MKAFSDYFIDEDDDISFGAEGGCVKVRSENGTLNIWFSGPRKELIAKAVVAAVKFAKGEDVDVDA